MDKSAQTKKGSDQMQADLDEANAAQAAEHARNTAPNPTMVLGQGPVEIPPVPHHGHEGIDPIVPVSMQNPPYIPENNPNPFPVATTKPKRDPQTGRAVGTPTHLGVPPSTEDSYTSVGTQGTWDGRRESAEHPTGGASPERFARSSKAPGDGNPSGNP